MLKHIFNKKLEINFDRVSQNSNWVFLFQDRLHSCLSFDLGGFHELFRHDPEVNVSSCTLDFVIE